MKHWKLLFEKLLSGGDKIFSSFETGNGAEWQILLSSANTPKDDHLTISESGVYYRDIVEIEIPELFEHGSIRFENDLDKCFDTIRFVRGITVKTLMKEFGPAKGKYLSVTSGI